MRVLAQPILRNGRRVGTLRVANPLTPVDPGPVEPARTFVVVGSLAVVLAVAGRSRPGGGDRGAAATDHERSPRPRARATCRGGRDRSSHAG